MRGKQAAAHEKGRLPSRRIAALYDWAGAAVFALICRGMVFVFLVRAVGVEGDSMNPTLSDGEGLLVTPAVGRARRGEIVIVRRPDGDPLVKRVIAVGGDRVSIDPVTFRVVLNGQELAEEYAVGRTLPRDFGLEPRTIPDGFVMVLGDNREESRDSRSAQIGLIAESQIAGRVFFRFYPPARAGWVG